MDLYFTYESRDTLKSTLFITVKAIAKPNPEHSNKFEIKIKKKFSRRGVPFSRQHQGFLTTQNLVFSQMYQAL